MAPTFSKEAILSNSVDYFCLVCENYMKKEDDVHLHIAKPVHKKKLDATRYVEKYKLDCIRKVKKWYFCEFCNLLVTVTKLDLHVQEPKHIDNKSSQIFKRVGNLVIFFDEIAIEEDAWNGLVENTCTLCCTKYDAMNVHKNEAGHIINMIQTKVGYDNNKNIYRKLNDSFFHCLTCNNVFDEISSHFENTTHKEFWQICCNNLTGKYTQTNSSKEVTEDTFLQENFDNIGEKISSNDKSQSQFLQGEYVPSGEVKKSKIYINKTDSSEQYICHALGLNNYISQHKGDKTWCILCDWFMDVWNVQRHLTGLHHTTLLKMHKLLQGQGKSMKASGDGKNDSKTMETKAKVRLMKAANKMQLEEQKETDSSKPALPPSGDNDNQKDKLALLLPPKASTPDINENLTNLITNSSQHSDEIQKLIDQNNWTYVASSQKLYCKMCDQHIACSDHNINDHIKGTFHVSNRNEYLQKSKPKKLHIETVPTRQFINTIATIDSTSKYVVINEKFCIHFLSFIFVTVFNAKYAKCQLCEIDLNTEQVGYHAESEVHEVALKDSLVVVQKNSEFIREIRHSTFHCGFCNCLSLSWNDMESHLTTSAHKESKTSASWRLKQYLPDVVANRDTRQVQYSFIMNMITCCHGT